MSLAKIECGNLPHISNKISLSKVLAAWGGKNHCVNSIQSNDLIPVHFPDGTQWLSTDI